MRSWIVWPDADFPRTPTGKPRLGAIKITDLTRADIKSWHQSMCATPYEANRALAYCSRMLNLAATDWGLREGNPCTGIKRFPERKR